VSIERLVSDGARIAGDGPSLQRWLQDQSKDEINDTYGTAIDIQSLQMMTMFTKMLEGRVSQLQATKLTHLLNNSTSPQVHSAHP